MAFYNRAKLNAAEKAQVKAVYNKDSKMVDPNDKNIVLEKGKIDLGHKYGYEEKAMQKCAKKCGMSQKDYSKMMRNPDLYQWEDRSLNRSHVNECKNSREQIHNCMKVIREYKNRDNGKNLQPSRERNSPAQSKSASRQTGSKGVTSGVSSGGKGASSGGVKGR